MKERKKSVKPLWVAAVLWFALAITLGIYGMFIAGEVSLTDKIFIGVFVLLGIIYTAASVWCSDENEDDSSSVPFFDQSIHM